VSSATPSLSPGLPPKPESIHKILIIKPSALGDIVHTLPFLAALRSRFPRAAIHWVVARGLHRLLENHPLLDRLWVIDKDGWKKPGRLFTTLGEIAGLWRGLGREGYDLAVDLSGLFRSGLITAASRAKIRLGFSDSDEGSPFFYNDKIVGGGQIHAIDRYLKLAARLGCALPNPAEIAFPLPPFAENPPIMAELPARYLVMAPSAGKPANRWPAERFGQLAARLELPTVVIGGAGEAEIVAAVVRHAQGKAISLAGRTGLTELMAVLKRASFMVANDTGPMHLAVALQVPVFAIFGPANPVRTGPYGGMHTVIRRETDCAPCYRWQPCSHWRCLLDLEVDTVHDIIINKLNRIAQS